MNQRWWSNDADERYWMETTARPRGEIGQELWNWAEGTDGRRIGPTGLLDEMNITDIVFHYYQPEKAIVGYSTVTSDRAIHGTEDDGPRYDRPWTARKIGGLKAIAPAITLADIQTQSPSLCAGMAIIKARSSAPRHLALHRPQQCCATERVHLEDAARSGRAPETS